MHMSNPKIVVPKGKKISVALNFIAIFGLLTGVPNAPGQGALVGNYGVSDDFGGPVDVQDI